MHMRCVCFHVSIIETHVRIYIYMTLLLRTSELAYRGEFVTLRDIAFVHKKRKVTREEKLAQAKVRIHSLNPHKCCVQM